MATAVSVSDGSGMYFFGLSLAFLLVALVRPLSWVGVHGGSLGCNGTKMLLSVLGIPQNPFLLVVSMDEAEVALIESRKIPSYSLTVDAHDILRGPVYEDVSIYPRVLVAISVDVQRFPEYQFILLLVGSSLVRGLGTGLLSHLESESTHIFCSSETPACGSQPTNQAAESNRSVRET